LAHLSENASFYVPEQGVDVGNGVWSGSGSERGLLSRMDIAAWQPQEQELMDRADKAKPETPCST